MATGVAPSLFIPHGGGPMPLFDLPSQRDLRDYLMNDARKMFVLDRALKAIIVVSAHWENSPEIMISSSEHHELLYDYTFPQYPEAYNLTYDAPGQPQLAKRIYEAISRHNITPRYDPKRGWDHGVFIPMLLINPKAHIPIVSVSIMRSHDTNVHWRLGEALSEFRNEGIAILGSGMSYHNMYAFEEKIPGNEIVNFPFDRYLDRICDAKNVVDRKKLMLAWREQEGAKDAHPSCEADHFMPFIVTVGAAGKSKCERVFTMVTGNHFKLGAFAWL